MRFIANLLDQMQDRRVAFQNNRLIFSTQNVKNLFFFRDAGERLIDDGKFFQSLGRRVKLSESAVNQNQAGKRLSFILQTMIAALDRFLHAGEIVAQTAFGFFLTIPHGFAANNELTVVGLLHAARFPDNHRSHGVGALNMRNIEALNSLRRSGQIERRLNRLDDCFGAGLQYAETLDERLLGISLHEFEEGVFWAALRSHDFYAMAGSLG